MSSDNNSGMFYLGVGILIVSALLGAYLGLWVCVVGGISAIVSGFQSDPWNGVQIGLGVLRFMCSGFVGWITIAIGWALGLTIMETSKG